MNSVLSNELETKATESGMPTPASDKERPSLHTLGKVQANFSQGGQFQHRVGRKVEEIRGGFRGTRRNWLSRTRFRSGAKRPSCRPPWRSVTRLR